MTYLLDANGFIALLVPDHEHFDRVHHFFRRRPFATCPSVQLAALRFLTAPRRRTR
jgi:predicted nucleic acid-binding protein